ncbi:hypothetical protein ANMWB30_42760 [Arthrobacter sp. MWB30]|nr:hypothetical protein ANMWB30_42760 [Arthrobacter sp. MWB30]
MLDVAGRRSEEEYAAVAVRQERGNQSPHGWWFCHIGMAKSSLVTARGEGVTRPSSGRFSVSVSYELAEAVDQVVARTFSAKGNFADGVTTKWRTVGSV